MQGVRLVNAAAPRSDPVRALIAAILQRALEDLALGDPHRSRVLAWIDADGNESGPGSFLWCCEALALNADAVRSQYWQRARSIDQPRATAAAPTQAVQSPLGVERRDPPEPIRPNLDSSDSLTISSLTSEGIASARQRSQRTRGHAPKEGLVIQTAATPPPLTVLDIDASALSTGPDLIAEIYAGRLNVVLIRNALSPELAQSIVERVEAGEGAARLTHVADKFQIFTLGLALDTAESVDQYLQEAKLFQPVAEHILRDVPDGTWFFHKLLARAAAGRRVALPEHPDGPYNRLTIRRLPHGGRIPPHCEQEQLNRPAYDHIKSLIDTSCIISTYLTLRPPDRGGEVVISTLHWSDVQASVQPGERTFVDPFIDKYPSMTFLPGPGDCILFDGGRFFHRVNAVGGRTRWTLGGFLAESPSHEFVYFWA